MYIESFIGETIGRLESLAVVLSNQEINLRLVEEVLARTHQEDPRFSGFYWVTSTGDITIGSNELKERINLSGRNYFHQAVLTGKTQISEAHFGRITGRYVFSIATPAKDQTGQIKGVLVGSISLVEMLEVIQELVKDEAVQLIDETGKIILQTKELPVASKGVGSYVNLEVVPWKLNSIMILDHGKLLIKPFLIYLTIGFFLMSILFMLLQSFITKHKLAKELSLNEADKLRLIGIIATSTAHEIRNPLTGIKGFVSLLSKKYKDDKDQYYFSLILKEVDRINTIVSELLIVGKPAIASKEINHINDILSDIIPLIESEANLHNVQLTITMTTDPAFIDVSKDHLKQVILNLIKNALESMDSNGQLIISSEKTKDSVLIKIKDTGKGMSPEVLRDVFVPFFTLKETGTGLGLVVCKRILDSYGGELRIESSVGVGTQVTVQLPLVERVV
jgi:two-component system, sporulation sensor kinase D